MEVVLVIVVEVVEEAVVVALVDLIWSAMSVVSLDILLVSAVVVVAAVGVDVAAVAEVQLLDTAEALAMVEGEIADSNDKIVFLLIYC